MNFNVFRVNSTNIFPLANDTKGGQLMTEYNLTSRESVCTNENVKYRIGPSFAHSMDDFYVGMQTDGSGGYVASSTLEISAGRAVVNGHYIESLVPITIDMIELNIKAQTEGTEELQGHLSIGLRAMYAAETTMAGAMTTYEDFNGEEIYTGIQLVILPRDQFKIPTDVPTEQDQITAHLKLADFDFINGSITRVVPYENKLAFISGNRIENIDDILSDTYVTKTGLNPKKLYVFSGKERDPSTGRDTWCDATDSLIIWDAAPRLVYDKPLSREAAFGTTTSGYTQLYMPHKQVDGMTDTSGKAQYYADKAINLPLANYAQGTSGTVDKNYTNSIKAISQELQNIYRMPNGKQVGYIASLSDRANLPTINNNWKFGDYIVVGEDLTVDVSSDQVRAPSTMYVVLPGIVTDYDYHSQVANNTTVPSSLTGIELARSQMNAENGESVNTSDKETYMNYFDLSPNYHGQVDVDYFMIDYVDGDSHTYYYFDVSQSGNMSYSDPFFLTGEIPYAQENVIGGFLNVPDTALDGGYVYRDDTGHLRLLDYSLLRSGTLAYQLGEDFTIPSGTAHSEVQTNLDEYVNDRVAFPNANQSANVENPYIIRVSMDLESEEAASTINVYGIDSRFNTAVFLEIEGSVNANCTINITNCQKLRIILGNDAAPTINLYNSCLYYDADVINRLSAIQNMTLWYQRFEDTDPNIYVDNMTVTCVDPPTITEDLDYWTDATPNDNHYTYGLQSVTFGPDGTIVGCGLFVRNDTTTNVQEGKSVISSMFTLPQGNSLTYPQKRLTRQVKVSGTFVNAYPAEDGYMIMDTNFSALTNTYDPVSEETVISGTIAFYVDASLVESVIGLEGNPPLDCWESGAWHSFKGVAIS